MFRHIHAGAEVAQQHRAPFPTAFNPNFAFYPWVVGKSLLVAIAWSSLCRRKQDCEMLLGEGIAQAQGLQFFSLAGQAGM